MKKFLGIVALLSISIGVISANTQTVTGYEGSIYSDTSRNFWAGILLALTISCYSVIKYRSYRIPILTLVLSGWSLAALPSIRSYWYWGMGDSLRHFAWMNDVSKGVMSPTEIIYPALHLQSIILSSIMSTPLNDSTMMLTPAFSLVFITFTILSVRHLIGSCIAIIFATLTSIMFLQVNNFATHFMAHSSSIAIMYSSLVLFIFSRYYTSLGPNSIYNRRYSFLFFISLIGLLIYHPQQLLNMSLFVTATMISYYAVDNKVLSSWSNLVVALFSIILFASWATTQERIYRVMVLYMTRVTGFVRDGISGIYAGGGGIAEVDETQESIGALGGSLLELFVKSFIPSTVVAVSVLFYLGYILILEYKTGRKLDYVFHYSIGVSSVFFLYLLLLFVGDFSQSFRYHGFIFLVLTILFPIVLFKLSFEYSTDLKTSTLLKSIVFVIVIMVIITIPVAHMSPYIHLNSPHVSEMQIEGYETVYEYQGDSTNVVGIRASGYRYSEAAIGYNEAQRSDRVHPTNNSAPFNFNFKDLNRTYNSPIYLTVGSHDEFRELNVFGGAWYSEQTFNQLEYNNNSIKTYNNGEFRSYRIDTN